jgi:hypothetical protein
MNEFEDWVMTLPEQPLTEELKIEILSKVNKMIQGELITMLRNMSTQ